jgi:ATP-dependent RNA helicase RhlE
MSQPQTTLLSLPKTNCIRTTALTKNGQGFSLKTFEEIELIAPLQRALREENYHTPTPIQAQTIPAAIEGYDVLGCAQTGTGKTAAFALPILNELGHQNRRAIPNSPVALILAPTRELAIQIGDSFKTYGRHLKLRCAMIYGGVKQGSQVANLQRGVHILVATPGRLLDLMNQGFVHLDQLEMFVLDEADRMMDMGFLPDLKRIIKELPEERQSLFFSATLPPKITELAQSLLFEPITVQVNPQSVSADRIKQQVLFTDKGGKQAMVEKILSEAGVERAIVFTRTKRIANTLTLRLEKSGFKAAVIHGNKSQGARERALEAFRCQKVQVLVATDVASRGIDIDGVTHVINFDIPNEPEAYVHRIGRTARAGAEGIAISLCTAEERLELRAIEQLIGRKIPAGNKEPVQQPVQQRALASDAQQKPRAQKNPYGKAFNGPRKGDKPRTGPVNGKRRRFSKQSG